mgnify:CR=1 FL=1
MKTQFDFNELFEGEEESLVYKTETAVLGFTEEVVARMKSQDVSRADLARKLGCSPAYVTKILRGSTNFTLETMVKIADVLGCKVRTHLAAMPDEKERLVSQGTPNTESDRYRQKVGAALWFH